MPPVLLETRYFITAFRLLSLKITLKYYRITFKYLGINCKVNLI